MLDRYGMQPAFAQDGMSALPAYTGPGANPYWNAVGPYATYPQKLPLLRLTDRPVQLETPRHYFNQVFTPNEATFVRYHLPGEPNSVDMTKWRLQLEGEVTKPLSLSLADLLNKFEPVEVAAVMQCSGNSRSFFQPRVPGGQWGNGAMANALWTGVRLSDLIKAAGLKAGAVEIQFQGLDFGKGPKGYGSHAFMKSWSIDDPILEQAIVAYAMNGEPLPMLNGFPVRMVFPGKFATYWLKHVTWIRVLDHKDSNFWMARAYRIPDTANGATTPEAVARGEVRMIPIGSVNLPVRSFLVSPDGSSKIPAGLPTMIRGIAFSGTGPVVKVEISPDNGRSWHPAALGKDYGPYSFRTWHALWTPRKPGQYTLAVRATDAHGHRQPDKAIWNPGGYLLNNILRQSLTVGPAA
ncbi:MAG: molybdopterin-dependent oxidoreductase [Alphaproteobacteria bacterium]|nr:molybdopterin-dependent oxidoreductase [Alphaproteobacteria bacterium]